MSNTQNNKQTIKVGSRDDKVLVINRNTISSAEYNREMGRVLAIASYKTYIDKQVVTPAIDLEVYEEFARPTKALQDLMAVKRILKEIEAEPIKPQKAAAKYTYETLRTRVPQQVTFMQAQGQNNSIIVEIKSQYTGTILAKINIGPKGGLNYELADEQPFIQNVIGKFDSIARKLVEMTLLDAPADIGDAYNKLIACVKDYTEVPKEVGRVKIQITGDTDESGYSDKLILSIVAGQNIVGTFGECSGNLKQRKMNKAHIADIVIPKAATMGVYIVRER